ncbi:hypothetical protein P7K49_004058 [Saguinus oedipus]|uniref:Uncharacterized protein n=1 Tax=Saguinus oedipus TaxID=9490 RepID=A0ABQ9W9U1_SAGOE|nr:hypothetical protein P7K49_004058 [Saguinus oedipus]
MAPPGAVQESFSHQPLTVDTQPEQAPQKPHLLEENGEAKQFSGTDMAQDTSFFQAQTSPSSSHLGSSAFRT